MKKLEESIRIKRASSSKADTQLGNMSSKTI